MASVIRITARHAAFSPVGFDDTVLDDDGFAPTVLIERRRFPRAVNGLPLSFPAAAPASAIPERAALAELRGFDRPASASTAVAESSGMPPPPPLAWLGRLEAVLERILPAPVGTLLGFFVCVSLAMATMSAMLPLLDRV